MIFIENLISKLDNYEKYLNQKDIKMLIYYSISYSYTNKKYIETNILLKLILNNEFLIEKKDAFLFNILIYAILTNTNLKVI
jgi:hypothetical protein